MRTWRSGLSRILAVIVAFSAINFVMPERLEIRASAALDADGYIVFEDPNFGAMFQPLGHSNPGNKVRPSDVAGINFLDVSGLGLTSLVGIEYFTGLSELYCDNNQLTTLDVSNNTALDYLSCSNNQLTALNVLNNTVLTYLDCSNNQLAALDLSNNTALATLYCYDNRLTALNLSNSTVLTFLDCTHNELTALSLSKNTALMHLYCSYNNFSSESAIIGLDNLNLTGFVFDPQNNSTGGSGSTPGGDTDNPIQLPNATRYVPYTKDLFDLPGSLGRGGFGPWVELLSGTLPPGLRDVVADGTATLTGLPTTAGNYSFVLRAWEGIGVTDFVDYGYTITVSNPATAFEYADEGFEIIQKVPDMAVSNIGDHDFIITDYHMEELVAVYISGRELVRDTEYTVREGSTVITIFARTFQSFGTGTHTLAAEFETDDGKLCVAAQTFTITDPNAHGNSNRDSDSTDKNASNDVLDGDRNTVSAQTPLVKLAHNLRNVDYLSLADLKAIAEMAKKEGKSPWLTVDAVSADGKSVDIRVGINPALATEGMYLAGSTDSQQAKRTRKLFERFFTNEIAATISLTQNGGYNQSAVICVKAPADADTDGLAFYSYNPETNVYNRIKEPNARIDNNGYLHFATSYANDIVISYGSMDKRDEGEIAVSGTNNTAGDQKFYLGGADDDPTVLEMPINDPADMETDLSPLDVKASDLADPKADLTSLNVKENDPSETNAATPLGLKNSSRSRTDDQVDIVPLAALQGEPFNTPKGKEPSGFFVVFGIAALLVIVVTAWAVIPRKSDVLTTVEGHQRKR